MEPSRALLTDRLVELLERMYVEMRHCVPEEWSGIELTIPQLKTLVRLRDGSARMSAIAEFLGTSLPSATSMIERLVDKDLVERSPDPQDRRVVTCMLTPKGQNEVERIWHIERMTLVKLADCMQVDELGTVVKAMEILHRASQSIGEEVGEEISPGKAASPAD